MDSFAYALMTHILMVLLNQATRREAKNVFIEANRNATVNYEFESPRVRRCARPRTLVGTRKWIIEKPGNYRVLSKSSNPLCSTLAVSFPVLISANFVARALLGHSNEFPLNLSFAISSLPTELGGIHGP